MDARPFRTASASASICPSKWGTRSAQSQRMVKWTPVFGGKSCKAVVRRDEHMGSVGNGVPFFRSTALVVRGRILFLIVIIVGAKKKIPKEEESFLSLG